MNPQLAADKKKWMAINLQRRDNYASHYESRQIVKELDDQTLARMRNVVEVVRPPKLNEYGCADYSEPEWNQLIDYANQARVKASLCLKWYLSDADWDNFQVAWKLLPDTIHTQFQVLVEKKSRKTQVEMPVDN